MQRQLLNGLWKSWSGGALVVITAVLALAHGDCAEFRHTSEGISLGDGGTSADGGGPRCSNSKCMAEAGGIPSVCTSDNRCVVVPTEECRRIFPEEAIPDDYIVVGFLEDANNGDVGTQRAQSVELAFSEINTLGGVPTKSGARKLALVECNYTLSKVEGAKHLVDDLGVQAIINPGFSDPLLQVARTETIPKNVLVISGTSSSPALTTLQKNGLLWRLTPSEALSAGTIAEALRDIDPVVRAQAGGGDIKVAMAVSKNVYGSAYQSFVEPKLRFNGDKDVTANGDANYKAIEYDIQKPTDIIGDLKAMAPHVVIALGTNETLNNIALALDSQWPSGLTYQPYFIFTQNVVFPGVLDFITESQRRRMRGVRPVVPNSPLLNTFQRAYAQAFGTSAEKQAVALDRTYVAGYLIAYAYGAAASTGTVSASSLSEGMKRLDGGETQFKVGKDDFFSVFNALESTPNSKVSLNATYGEVHLDPNTGEPTASSTDIEIWCVKNNELDPSKKDFISSGKYFSGKDNAFKGTFGTFCTQ
jgi:ABC-type branched-subunit amino acid transport system substrate-binding protein